MPQPEPGKRIQPEFGSPGDLVGTGIPAARARDARAAGRRMVETGQVATCANRGETEPSSRPLRPPTPREPTTTISASLVWRSRMSLGRPSTTRSSAASAASRPSISWMMWVATSRADRVGEAPGLRVARVDRRAAACWWSGLGRDVLDVGMDDPQRQLEALGSVSRPRERTTRRVGTVDPDERVPHVSSLRARRCPGRHGTPCPSPRTTEERSSGRHAAVSRRAPPRHRATR